MNWAALAKKRAETVFIGGLQMGGINDLNVLIAADLCPASEVTNTDNPISVSAVYSRLE